ncbi:MAG: type II toxin-antitoxin system RelE/ParE family toxin [Defluviitaleaceae bacterium]|nr:type II toxin-antitoxin system RelE/ParE family toxin [Defluviitaleaceae bacterium]MCL2240630.1 type II toxin-antitoxin system RelE/ParE family toxin [Defluviitaleaceae bacterium]
MAWNIDYFKKAENDLAALNSSVRARVFKAINKVALNPLPQSEGGYGKPLGNKQSLKLAGCMKIKLKSLGLRVVYQLIRENAIMKIVIISIRDDEEVYKEAERRINKI